MMSRSYGTHATVLSGFGLNRLRPLVSTSREVRRRHRDNGDNPVTFDPEPPSSWLGRRSRGRRSQSSGEALHASHGRAAKKYPGLESGERLPAGGGVYDQTHGHTVPA